jgi:hypothetical protein
MEQDQDPRVRARCHGTRAWSTVPPRPLLLSALNAIGHGLDRLGLLRLTLVPTRLARCAQRRAGLEDFGDASLWEALECLTRSLADEARLTPTGRLMAHMEILQRLTNRLQIEHEIATHPQIREEPVPGPIFILGLPRTGTTFLQRLLGQDPANRVLETWEMARPIPAPRPETYATDSRIAKACWQVGVANFAMPRLKQIHEVGARLPEECLSLMANDLVSYWFVAAAQVPSYRAWLHAQDLTLAYRLHRRQLQLLQATFGQRRWVLKSPFHLYGLPALLAAYPDARIIQTHRDPVEVLPSFASFLVCLRSGFCNGIDPKAVGVELTEDLPRWFRQAAVARACAQGSASKSLRPHFRDVEYRALVADPVGTVRRIYEGFGLELSDGAERRMETFILSSPQHKHGVHRYSLEEFGIDADAARAIYPTAPA